MHPAITKRLDCGGFSTAVLGRRLQLPLPNNQRRRLLFPLPGERASVPTNSRDQILDDLPMHIRQTEAAALMEIHQPFVIHAKRS